MPTLRAELAARRALGFHCDWLEEGELLQRFGCRRPGAILSALLPRGGASPLASCGRLVPVADRLDARS